MMSAPLFALSFANGASVAILDPTPRGDTTEEETRLAKPVITDGRLQFGALGAWQADAGGTEFGFRFPGTSEAISGYRGATPGKRIVRRYHPITSGFVDSYQVNFRFGQ